MNKCFYKHSGQSRRETDEDGGKNDKLFGVKPLLQPENKAITFEYLKEYKFQWNKNNILKIALNAIFSWKIKFI